MPGDTLLAFLTEAPSGYEVFTARLDGSGIQQRTQISQQVPPFFDVTPDRNLILPLRPPGGGAGDIYEITFAGDTVRRLMSPTGAEAGSLSVSPDGQLIAFSGGSGVWIMNRDGSGKRPLMPLRRTMARASGLAQIAPNESPSWTPDGQFVLLQWAIDPLLRSDGQVYNLTWEIYAVRLSDGLAIRLTRSPQADVQPVFR